MNVKPAVILGCLLFIGIAAFLVVNRIIGEKVISNNQTATHVTTDTATTVIERNKVVFDYQPEKPVNGKLKGVIEIGATGFNSFVINIDSSRRWEVVAKDFGSSLVYEGLATTEQLQGQIANYLSKMFDKAVAKEEIYFVISSGAQKEPKTKIIADQLSAKGYVVSLITPELEALFGFLSAVPLSFRENAFFVDIGSGNTKMAWQVNGKVFTREMAGSKYYQQSLNDQDIYQEVLQTAKDIPDKNRAFCFIIGGIPFQLADQHRQGEERYTILKAPSLYKATDKRMEAGITIYKALFDATGCKFFVFDWDANFTIGYLLSNK